MSNTMNIDPNRLIVYRSASMLSIIAGSIHRRFSVTDDNREHMQNIYEAAVTFKNNPNEETKENLRKLIDPAYREENKHGFLVDVEGQWYLKEADWIPVPTVISEMIKEQSDLGIDITPVVNLWKLALTNPSDRARKDLMKYIEKFGIPITDAGYMILYKSVRDKNEVVEKLAYVVGQEFFAARQNRQDPHKLWVYERPTDFAHPESRPRFFVEDTPSVRAEVYSGESTYEVWWSGEHGKPDAKGLSTREKALHILEELGGDPDNADAFIEEVQETEVISLPAMGTLADIFQDVVLNKQDVDPDEKEKEPVWEPYYSGDYGMEIRLGEPVPMPREECDPDINVDCSEGLHVGSYEYVKAFHPNDGTVLACLVNPRDIVALPKRDHSKIRTCLYMPYAVMKENEDGHWEEAESGYWEEDFIDYEKEQIHKEIDQLRLRQSNDDDSSEKTQKLIEFYQSRLVDLS